MQQENKIRSNQTMRKMKNFDWLEQARLGHGIVANMHSGVGIFS